MLTSVYSVNIYLKLNFSKNFRTIRLIIFAIPAVAGFFTNYK